MLHHGGGHFHKATGDDDATQAKDIQCAGNGNGGSLQRLSQPGLNPVLFNVLAQVAPGFFPIWLRSLKTFQQPADGNKRFHAASGTAAATAMVAGDGRMADFAADGQGTGQRFAADNDRTAHAFTEVHEQKILAIGMDQLVAERQGAFLLHEQDRHPPDFLDNGR